jgi:release factor glutamine methyltransferase
MRIKEYLPWARAALKEVSETPQLDAEVLLAAVLQKPRSFVVARPEFMLSSEQKKQVGIFLRKRIERYPVAYILQKSEFYGLEFFVNADVLVPRPESEQVVEQAIRYLKAGGTLVDIGTGSGAIAIATAKNATPAKVIGLDISSKALAVARQNATIHQIEIEFLQSNLLHEVAAMFAELPKPIVLTVNLPYVPNNERHPSVRREPESAIYSGADGLEHYRRFFVELEKTPFSVCIFEFHPPQKQRLEEMFKKLFPDCYGAFYKDTAGLWRVGVIANELID